MTREASNMVFSDENLCDVLRISGEPFKYYFEKDVHLALTRASHEYFCYMKSSLADIAKGEAEIELPPKQLFDDPLHNGDFRVMPCVVRRGSQVTKTVKLVGTNGIQSFVKDQITVGKAFVLHPEENFISHMFEACLLSSARTGVCAALAVDLLAASKERVAVVGAGRVGYYAANYVATLKGVKRIDIIDVNLERAEAVVRSLAEQIPADIILTAKDVIGIEEAEVVILATTSRLPICHPGETRAQLVVSLGADTDSQSELHTGWIEQADLFVDVMDSVRFGDLSRWLDMGLISHDRISDLFSLYNGLNIAGGKKRRVFVSTGSALFDNLTMAYLLAAFRTIRAEAKV